MPHPLLGLPSLLLGAAALAAFVPHGGRAIGVLAIVSLGAYGISQLLRCRHASPGLLPPIVDGDGTRVGARWYCHDCGRTWDAAFDRETRPVQRYSGYDASKAVASARRADHLTRQQRGLAVRRSGIAGRARTIAPPGSARVAADVVAIMRARRAAK